MDNLLRKLELLAAFPCGHDSHSIGVRVSAAVDAIKERDAEIARLQGERAQYMVDYHNAWGEGERLKEQVARLTAEVIRLNHLKDEVAKPADSEEVVNLKGELGRARSDVRFLRDLLFAFATGKRDS
jgi:hypothetical protein